MGSMGDRCGCPRQGQREGERVECGVNGRGDKRREATTTAIAAPDQSTTLEKLPSLPADDQAPKTRTVRRPQLTSAEGHTVGAIRQLSACCTLYARV